MKPSLTIERTAPTCITVRVVGMCSGWEQRFLCRGDAHLDNLLSDRELVKTHLKEAKDYGAYVLDFGDNFCAMQGKWDKRADPRQFLPELQSGDYLDALVRYHDTFNAPYADRFALLAMGNHETSVRKHHETNLTERLAERLKTRGSPVQVGTMQGWVRFHFQEIQGRGGTHTTVRLRYHHGYGGGGQVTEDRIQAQRQMAYIANADIIVSAHTHHCWYSEQVVEELDHNGIPRRKTVELVKMPSYKDEYSSGEGYAVERGDKPKPLGAWWLRFWYKNHTIHREFTRAR